MLAETTLLSRSAAGFSGFCSGPSASTCSVPSGAGQSPLSALPQQVFAQFLGLGARLLVAGLAIGGIGAWAASQAMQSLLFGVGAWRFGIFAATAGVMFCVAFLAMLLPLRRARRSARSAADGVSAFSISALRFSVSDPSPGAHRRAVIGIGAPFHGIS